MFGSIGLIWGLKLEPKVGGPPAGEAGVELLSSGGSLGRLSMKSVYHFLFVLWRLPPPPQS
ncbi:hypothetical protein A3C26_02060 [Candidatus Daviesbacteria bacterium RIFCSPHIGHO2_02_FULL_39_12]|uniref:Uncharacterized protein n=1 Tax=Candidatus Daviesbacteria bacterium RIFCSPHIGHO2_02_FULL_39_12 TaxID=1797770 RepID=A0A1F5J8Z4_9BACT|nr:MAG: hypothetical protein A3C26_02060 [Candidatus Daviesbacteria bacterium RIFCSPHIGHO2_02_FULL_39_12]